MKLFMKIIIVLNILAFVVDIIYGDVTMALACALSATLAIYTYNEYYKT